MAVAFVQSAGAAPVTSATLTLTLTGTPVAGNVLAAFCSYSQAGAARTINTPSGWVKWDDATSTANDGLAVFTRVVQGGDGTGYSWTITGASNDLTSGVIYEYSGVNTGSPVNQHNITLYNSSVSAFATTAVTPSVLACQAIAGLSLNDSFTISSVGNSGGAAWTHGVDGWVTSSFHTTYSATQNSVTADTTTALTATFNTSGATFGAAAILLLAPAPPKAAGTAAPGKTWARQFRHRQLQQQPAAAAAAVTITATASVAGAGSVAAITSCTYGDGAYGAGLYGTCVPYPSPPPPSAPGRTWLRRFHHRPQQQAAATATVPRAVTNIFEGGTNGVTVSAANSGGASRDAFDLVSVASGATLAYDSARAAHGGLSCQVATVATGTSYAQWAASAGSMPQAFFRIYLYFTANPGTQHRIFSCLSGGAPCASILVTTAGKIQVLNAGGTQITITTASIPLGAWFRIEGYVTGSPAAGQTELKLFTASPDALTADETNTSAAVQNTGGAPDTYRFGAAFSVAGAGPYWQDDIGLSPSGYLGPVLSPGAASLAGAGAVATVVTQAATATVAGAGAVTANAAQAATAAPAGAGSAAAAVTQAVTAAPAGAGAVTTAVTGAVTASPAGAGAVTAAAAGAATATAAGAGAVTAAVAQAATASVTGAGSVAAVATTPGGASTATVAGAGAVTAVAAQAVTASPAGAGTVTAAVAQAATASVAAAGAVTANVTWAATATVAGAGAVTANAAQAATAAPAGAGSVTSAVTEAVTAAAAGAGAVTAFAAGAGNTAAVAGAGTVTAAATVAVTATAAGTGAVAASVTWRGSASLTGAGSVNANAVIPGTAGLTGAGAVTAKTAQLGVAGLVGAGTLTALAAQAATAQLTAAGAVTAAGTSAAGIVKAASTAAVTAAVTSAATVTDPRDGAAAVTGAGSVSSVS